MGLCALLTACKKDKTKDEDAYGDGPRTEVPATLQGKWMYGNFSLTEYWSTNPSTYLGPAVQYAFAFDFQPNGTYTQYFTSGTAGGGGTTYQQSVTKGTVEVNGGTLVTHAASAHYKQTRNGQTVEERDLAKSELAKPTTYTYTTGTEPNGTKAVYLTMQGTSAPLTFLQKF